MLTANTLLFLICLPLGRAAPINASSTDIDIQNADRTPPDSLQRCTIDTDSTSNCTSVAQLHSFSDPTTLSRRGISKEYIKSQAQSGLAHWINWRFTDPSIEPKIEQLVTAGGDNNHIELILLDGRSVAFGIPTSRFTVPGDQPFAWGVNDMRGCTSLFVIREPGPNTAGGVYLSHIWEAPGFNNVWGDGKIVLPAQHKAYVTDFLRRGFPNPSIQRRQVEGKRLFPDPPYQDSLAQHKDALRGGKAIIITPQQYFLNDEGKIEMVPDQARWGPAIEEMKKEVRRIVPRLHFYKDFLYVPNLEDTEYELSKVGQVGKILVEYDPDSDKKKTAMLLVQDGGEQLEGNGGPGGPFFYDFGKAKEAVNPQAKVP